MDKIELQNAHVQVVIDVDHGAEIVSLAQPGGPNLLAAPTWQTPLLASASRSYGNDTIDWHSEYRGGWQELFPNAGASCEVLGVPLPFHGEVSRARWQWQWVVEYTQITLQCPARLPLLLERTMRLDPQRPVLYLEERITNESSLTVPYIWSHHPAFGPPLAAAGAHIDLPAGRVIVDAGMDGPAVDLVPGSEHQWPLVHGKQDRSIDLSIVPPAPLQRLCYLELSAGWFAVRNPTHALGVALAWDLTTFPYAWLWQEIGGGQELPWYGRGHFVAIEPATQWPSHGLAAAIKTGQAHSLAPHQQATTSLACVLFSSDERAVSRVSRDGTISFHE